MTIKKTLLGAASVAALAFAASAAPAAAEDREFGWSITLGATSDYIFRGLSFNNEDPAAQGSIDMSYGIFYAGAWASNISGAGFEPWELDIYAGIKPVLGPVTFDLGIVGYLYPAADTFDKEYIELKAGASMEIVKSLTGGITFWYSPDQLDVIDPVALTSDGYAETWSIEGTLAYALPQFGIFSPTVSGLLGYTEDLSGLAIAFGVPDYTYWNAGLTLGVEKFSMDFRYWDTDISGNGLADERFVFSAKVTLP